MMIERYRDMIDRLQAKEALDRWMFLGFAIVGSAIIWISKGLGVDAIVVAILAAASMIGYAVIVSRGEKLKQRADQLGDNCYYLGLLYTLASLSFAIFTFDPANTATTIVQGFGIALISTILGLALRVYFIQGQPDLASAEENTRIALTEAAARVRAELDGVLQAFATFATQTQQHLVELRDDVRADVVQTTTEAKNSTLSIASEAKQAIAGQANETVAEVRKIAASVGRVVKSLESHADVLGVIAERSGGQLEQIKAMESAGQAAAGALDQVTRAADLVQKHQASLDENSKRLVTASESMATSMSAMQKAAAEFETLMEARIASIGSIPERALDRIDDALDSALSRWKSAIDAQVRGIEEAQGLMAQARADEIGALKRHNEELAAEVRSSREKVGQVHSALVEMTSELTSQISAQS